MKPLIFKGIEIRKPRYDPNPEKSTTNNSEWRQGLFVMFEDYNGNKYDYMPKWVEIDEMLQKKYAVEMINKDLAKKKYKEENENGE